MNDPGREYMQKDSEDTMYVGIGLWIISQEDFPSRIILFLMRGGSIQGCGDRRAAKKIIGDL